jgi:8-oxo-dGTP diphosphatase
MADTRFAVTVDLVMLTVRAGTLQVLLVTRAIDPFRGTYALPGGFVLPDEDLPAAAHRELVEETGLTTAGGHLEQLASYGTPDRDPRGRVVTVAYLAMLPDPPDPVAGSDAATAQWAPLPLRPGRPGQPATLAFDHGRILADGVERARSKLEYTALATAFCPPEFTISELRAVYETVWGASLDPRNFHRKVTGTPGFVEPVGRSVAADRGRPAQLFRRGPADLLHPPMLRKG